MAGGVAEGVAQRRHDDLAMAWVEDVGVAGDVAEQAAEVRRRCAAVMNDRAHRVARARISGPSVAIDLANAQAGGRVSFRVQLAPPEEAVVAELEPGNSVVGVEVEEEVSGVALAVADVGQGEAIRIGLL